MADESTVVDQTQIMIDALHAVVQQGQKMDALRDDVAAVYERLREVRSNTFETNMRVGRLEDKVSALRTRVERLDDRVGKLDERVGRLDERVGKLDERVGKLDERVDGFEQRTAARFDGLERRMEENFTYLRDGYIEVKVDIQKILERIN